MKFITRFNSHQNSARCDVGAC